MDAAVPPPPPATTTTTPPRPRAPHVAFRAVAPPTRPLAEGPPPSPAQPPGAGHRSLARRVATDSRERASAARAPRVRPSPFCPRDPLSGRRRRRARRARRTPLSSGRRGPGASALRRRNRRRVARRCAASAPCARRPPRSPALSFVSPARTVPSAPFRPLRVPTPSRALPSPRRLQDLSACAARGPSSSLPPLGASRRPRRHLHRPRAGPSRTCCAAPRASTAPRGRRRGRRAARR